MAVLSRTGRRAGSSRPTGPLHQPQHPAGAVVYGRFRQCAAFHRRQHFLLHVGAAAGHIQVAPRPEALNTVIHGPPVGDHHAVKAPFRPQNVRQQLLVVGAVDAVELRVGAHDGGGPALLHGGLKGGEVQLPQGASVHHAVRVEAGELLGVGGEVLEAGTHPLALHAADKARCQLSRQVGIFAEILKIPPAQRVTLQVGPRPQHQAYPLGAGLLRDGRADLLQQFGIPAAGSGHLRGEAGGGAGLIYPQHRAILSSKVICCNICSILSIIILQMDSVRFSAQRTGHGGVQAGFHRFQIPPRFWYLGYYEPGVYHSAPQVQPAGVPRPVQLLKED